MLASTASRSRRSGSSMRAPCPDCVAHPDATLVGRGHGRRVAGRAGQRQHDAQRGGVGQREEQRTLATRRAQWIVAGPDRRCTTGEDDRADVAAAGVGQRHAPG